MFPKTEYVDIIATFTTLPQFNKVKKILYLLLLSANLSAQTFTYPVAKMDTVTDRYFGSTVADPYRWLEYDSLENTRQWLREEKDLSEKYLAKLKRKYTPEIQLGRNSYVMLGTIHKSGGYYFDYVTTILQEQRVSIYQEEKTCLYIKKGINDEGREIVDPSDFKNKVNDKVRITDFAVSPDNTYLAFSLSRRGSDWQEIRVKDIKSFRNEADVVTGVKFSSIGWSNDGFFYLRYPQKGDIYKEVNTDAAVWYHQLGTEQTEDKLIYADPEHPHANVRFNVTGRHLIIYNSASSSNIPEVRVLKMDLSKPFPANIDTLIYTHNAGYYAVIGMYNKRFLVNTTFNAPRGQLALYNKDRINDAAEFIPEYKEVLHEAHIIGNKVVCTYLKDIDYMSVTFDSTGRAVNKIDFPVGCSAHGFEGTAHDSETLFYVNSFLHPAVVYKYNINTLATDVLKTTQVLYNSEDFDMEKVYYYSKDSEKIPMIIAYRNGMQHNGKTPAILYGYGGFGVVTTPFFDKGFISFLQNGGIIALPCLRGGGEFGDDWHKKGKGLNKQNVVDDFIAAADYLVHEKYTTNEKLAIMGGSHGGMLVAAAINQRPDVCKVAIADKGVYDMLRYQNYTVGRSLVSEFGSSKDSAQFGNLLKYSPLHNVRDPSYPAVLVITGDHDDRAVPLHSYKYAAAMQKKNKSDNPVFLYVEKNAGHQQWSLDTYGYVYSFIYDQLGIPPNKTHNINY